MRRVEKARNKFQALPEEQQLAIVREVCGRRGADLIKKYGVCAVGAGYKKSDGAVLPQTCIGFLVGHKKTDPDNPVPPEIITFIQEKGKRTLYAIPTDIEEMGSGAPQFAANLAHGIRAVAAKNQALALKGATCCIVRQKNSTSNRFLLGCHHVLALSLLSTQCSAADAYVRPRNSTETVGRLYEYLPLAASGRPCLDAALALASPSASLQWSAGGRRPTKVEPGVQRPLACRIYTPEGDIPATFVKEWANVPLPYPRCGMVVIEAAYQFVAPTLEGHSGSAVMESDGTLHGMHFWGDVTQNMAFAIPAFMLFRPGRFSVDFELE